MLKTVERKIVKILKGRLIVSCPLLEIHEGRRYWTARVDIYYYESFAALVIRGPKDKFPRKENFEVALRGEIPVRMQLSEATIEGERNTIYGRFRNWWQDEMLILPLEEKRSQSLPLYFLVKGEGKRTAFTEGGCTPSEGKVVQSWKYYSRTGCHWETIYLVESENVPCLKCENVSGRGNLRVWEECPCSQLRRSSSKSFIKRL